jgi:hypothetical protein
MKDAGEAFEKCLVITEKLVELGIADEKENVDIYKQLITTCKGA